MTLTDESLALLAGFARYIEPRKEMADRLAAIEAAAVKRAETYMDEALASHSEGPHHHYNISQCLAADPTLASDAENSAELRKLREALPEGWTLRVYLTHRTPVWSVSVHMPGTRADAKSRAIGRGHTIAEAARAAREALETKA